VEAADEGTVLVLGQAVKQGSVAWTTGMTLRECLSKAGGPSTFANLRCIRLVIAGEKLWQGRVMLEREIDVRPAKPDVEVPDQSVIIVPEKKVIF
jgi:protein involved in polysaccharide export with SLBB domain